MKTTFVTEEHGYLDYDVTGEEGIRRACVPVNIKRGDIFNVYCFDSSKFGCTWYGTLEKSLEILQYEKFFMNHKREIEGKRPIRMLYNAYYGGNESRNTYKTRAFIVNRYDREKNLHIYCPERDFYVSDYFMNHFYNLNSTFAELMFDEGATLLERLADDKFKWRLDQDIIISTPTEIIVSHTLLA